MNKYLNKKPKGLKITAPWRSPEFYQQMCRMKKQPYRFSAKDVIESVRGTYSRSIMRRLSLAVRDGLVDFEKFETVVDWVINERERAKIKVTRKLNNKSIEPVVKF